MEDDAETLTPEPESAAVPPASDREPAFLVRARRILGGDIRPEDYLPVTPEVQRRVDLFMDWARSRAQGQPPPLPEVETRQLRMELLSYHHGGENIAYIEDDKGILVLGVGLAQAGQIVRTFASQTPYTIAVDAPFPWDAAGELASGWIAAPD